MLAFKHIGDKKLRIRNPVSKMIVEVFKEIEEKYFYQRKQARKPNSNAIKYCLVDLGHQKGFRVYSNGLTQGQCREQERKHKFESDFVCREFLYDIHWYKDLKGAWYTPEEIILVAESELGDRRKGDKSGKKNPAIKYDFQKLLVANAELRLMIFKINKMVDMEEIDGYFVQAIKAYKQLKARSAFLFICFVHELKQIFISEKFK